MPSANKPQNENPICSEPAAVNRKPQAAFDLGYEVCTYVRNSSIEDCLLELHDEIPVELYVVITQTLSEMIQFTQHGDAESSRAPRNRLRKQTACVFGLGHPCGPWFCLGAAFGSQHEVFIRQDEHDEIERDVRDVMGLPRIDPEEWPADSWLKPIFKCIRDLSPQDVEQVCTLQRMTELEPENRTRSEFLKWWREYAEEITGHNYHGEEPFSGLATIIGQELLEIKIEVKVPAVETKIPSEFRTIPISFRAAGRLMGKARSKKESKDAAEWLSKMVIDGKISCEHISKQRHIFDKRDFPQSAWPFLSPAEGK